MTVGVGHKANCNPMFFSYSCPRIAVSVKAEVYAICLANLDKLVHCSVFLLAVSRADNRKLNTRLFQSRKADRYCLMCDLIVSNETQI